MSGAIPPRPQYAFMSCSWLSTRTTLPLPLLLPRHEGELGEWRYSSTHPSYVQMFSFPQSKMPRSTEIQTNGKMTLKYASDLK
jgi:hypothetical protein